jgi:hypothetical protein
MRSLGGVLAWLVEGELRYCLMWYKLPQRGGECEGGPSMVFWRN